MLQTVWIVLVFAPQCLCCSILCMFFIPVVPILVPGHSRLYGGVDCSMACAVQRIGGRNQTSLR